MAVTEEQVKEALSTVDDPELGFNIVDLGLVYEVQVEDSFVNVTMTLTSMACPVGPEIVSAAREAVSKLDGVEEVNVNLVFNPPWQPEMMREEIRWLFGRG